MVVVLNNLDARIRELLFQFHVNPTAGQTGFKKTCQQLSNVVYWEGVLASARAQAARSRVSGE